MHPVDHQKWKLKRKINYMNPFFYLGRIKRNLFGGGHHKHH